MGRLLLVEALQSLWAHPSRTILILLGVVVGLSAVIVVMAAGEGGKAIIMEEFQGMGPDTLIVQPNWAARSEGGSFRVEFLTPEDVADLERYGRFIRDVTPVVQLRTVLETRYAEKQLTVTGTTLSFINFWEFSLAEGRLITEEEVRTKEKVAIVGSLVAEELFPGGNAVGEYVRIAGEPVRVVGVLARKEKTYGVSLSDPDETFNNSVILPVYAFERIFSRRTQDYEVVFCKAVSLERVLEAKREILEILEKRHGRTADGLHKFMVVDMKTQIQMIDQVIGTITTAVAILAGIALLVAAIGIMNVMLVSVKERTREIGIRKAIGAKRRHVVVQFLLESLLVCGGGGLLGIGVSYLVAYLVGEWAGWPVLIDLKVVFFAFFLALATGMLSGVYPAGKAGSLMPHEALRYE
ncbi:ABC transporter permease [Spirochaeta thermophila]|uniref:Transporter n=1 Tax=Winmispira thermophila (strain ATCC 49972 / DSM 6192 / RI 19.B1) TaxID=665571 RepID=E0RQ14_WINT6|nr:ABC transporter permease [Spirochaeta thermophila]ADN02867.1 transporter [Spirochaeta thermophila DSM 6192]